MPDEKTTHTQLCDTHQKAAERYVQDRTTAYVVFQHLVEADEEARKALIESGALVVDESGKIKVGWYKSDDCFEDQRVEGVDNTGVWVRGGATAIIGAIGLPAGAWTVVGAFGAASTGAAISGLSGAAATGATAAWFGGGAVATGGLGLAVAPFVLSGIGIAAGVGVLGVAALVSHKRNSQKELGMRDANSTMVEAMDRMEVNRSRLNELADCAKQASNRLIRATGVLLVNRNREAVDLVGEALNEAGQLYSKLEEPLPHPRLYIGRPSPLESMISITTTRDSVTMRWEDPDEGSSEVDHYRILYSEGWGGERSLATAYETEFTHTGLKPSTRYTYRLIPVNKIGEGGVQRPFEARTQSV